MTTTGTETTTVDFVLNGVPVSKLAATAETTLLDLIRDSNLTGAKEGCAEGECGACMVLMVESHPGGGSIYRPVNSCLMLAPMAAGREIYTVESFSEDGQLCEAQQAMAAGGGSQCGYCTPGFVVSLFAEHYRPHRSGPCSVEALEGNLCRCTGYRPIADAARSLGAPPPGPFLDRLSQPTAALGASRWENGSQCFERPVTIEAAIAAAGLFGDDARFIAGATDLAVESNILSRRLPHLISLEAIPELREFSETPQEVRIGAGLPLSEIEHLWTSAPLVFREWIPQFASPAIRNRATLGGSLATASPIGDSAPLLMALDAQLDLAGPSSPRSVAVADFFTGYRKSVLAHGELIKTIRIPKPFPTHARFFKIAKRRVDDISTVAVAIAVTSKGATRIGLGGVGPTPITIRSTAPLNSATLSEYARILDTQLRPRSDFRGSAEYRLEVTKSLLEKFVYELEEASQ